MKKIILSFILITAFGCLFAQKNIEKSQSFELFEGYTKVIMLRNNNTGLLEVTKKDGISFTLFDGARKKISSKKLDLKKVPENLGFSNVEGCYDIGGDFTFFIFVIKENSEGKKMPSLFRVILNGSTGDIKSEDVVTELNEYKMSQGYGLVFGDVDPPGIFVEKDPESDYYAVIRYNTLDAETNNRIEVIHYGPDHKEIQRGKYVTPSNKYKFTKYIGAYVHKDNYVLIGTYAFNTEKSGGEEARYYVAQLNKGKTNFVQKELAYTAFCKKANGVFTFNKVRNVVNMTIVQYKGLTSFGGILFQSIDPTTLQLEKPYTPDLSKLDEYYTTKMERKKSVYSESSTPQGFFIDKTGNLTAMYQYVIYKVQPGQYGMPAQIIATELMDIGLVTMGPDGKVIKSTMIPYATQRNGDKGTFSAIDVKKGKKGPFPFMGGTAWDWCFGIDLISTETNDYLLCNNLMANVDMPENEKPKMITAIKYTNAMKYTLSGPTPKKDYIFGTPEGKKDGHYCNFSGSDYNPTTKIYATVVADLKDDKSTVVWIKIE